VNEPPLVYYCCSSNIAWVREAGHILLVDRETGESWSLHDAEEVIWDLLAVGYSYEKIVQILSLTLSLSADQADHTLSDVLRNWRDAGIVQVSGDIQNGEPGNQCCV
jgi:hypothetical protein